MPEEREELEKDALTTGRDLENENERAIVWGPDLSVN